MQSLYFPLRTTPHSFMKSATATLWLLIMRMGWATP